MADSVKADKKFEWERTGGVTVYNSPRWARYPSIARVADNAPLVLFTRQTIEEEKACGGALVLAWSTDEANTWSVCEVIFQCETGEPRTMNTMTTLKNGRLVVPFAEVTDKQVEPGEIP